MRLMKKTRLASAVSDSLAFRFNMGVDQNNHDTEEGTLLGPKYQEIVNIHLGDGTTRRGQVLEVYGDKAVVQVGDICLAGRI
ncbi:hypothetical protein AAG906_007751 [Vitis piasezkii]